MPFNIKAFESLMERFSSYETLARATAECDVEGLGVSRESIRRVREGETPSVFTLDLLHRVADSEGLGNLRFYEKPRGDYQEC